MAQAINQGPSVHSLLLPDPRGTHYSLQDVASAVDVRYTPSIPTGVLRQFGLPGLPHTRVGHISSVVTAGSPIAAAANAVNRAERGEAPSRSFREPQDSCLQEFHGARVAEAEETLEKRDHVSAHVRRGELARKEEGWGASPRLLQGSS